MAAPMTFFKKHIMQQGTNYFVSTARYTPLAYDQLQFLTFRQAVPALTFQQIFILFSHGAQQQF